MKVKHALTSWLTHELQTATRAAVTDRAERMADDLSDELRQIYLDWLDEVEAQVDDAESDRERDAAIAALLLLLLGRVRRRVDLRLAQLANDIDADGPFVDAMREQMDETIDVFENSTLPAIEDALNEAVVAQDVARRMDDAPEPVADSLSGNAARVALVGGALWSSYQAGKKQAAAQVGLLARWTGPGPGDPNICGPCADQMAQGLRPVSQTPVPGPEICLGLTNCRHNLSFHDPVTGERVHVL